MATESFFRDIVIKDRKSAKAFINALEKAERKPVKEIKYNIPVNTITDKKIIQEMFGA